MLFETNTVVALDQIKGVAQKRKNALQQAGIFCLYDLFCCLPKSYEDRSRIEAIESVVSDTKTGIIVKVMAAPAIHYIKRKKSTVKIKVSSGDMTGSVVIFNAPYQAKKFEIGKQYHVFGRIQRTLTDFVVYNPIVGELADLSKNLQIYPVYKIKDDVTAISQSVMRGIVQNAWEQYGNNTADMWPEELKKRFFVQDIVTALRNVHLPQEMTQAEQGKERFAFDEIFATLLLLYEEKSQRIRRKNHYIIKNDIYDEFVGQLPFKPTTAQRRAMKEIAQDIKKQDKVMNRLLQGDVGSGKTTVAFYALLMAAVGGFQSAMMTPTELLAKQHYKKIKPLAAKWNLDVVLLTSSTEKKERESIKTMLAGTKPVIAIGTHALFSKDIAYRQLALVVTDEQHKFGVLQRAALARKGFSPHVLLMSATPIPRTLALVMYASLDISVIDSVPPGRKQVRSFAVDSSHRERIYRFIQSKAAAGEQCYIVCAGIEKEENDIFSLEEQYEEARKALTNISVAIIHGQMDAQQKNRIAQDFFDKKISVLVATTIVEIGLDAADATLMVINNAERFGLSQLHQMRGRVGRSDKDAECIFITDSTGDIATRRMEIITQSTDGFEIAQKDLELRGPGEMTGQRQHGIFRFRYADILRMPHLVFRAQEAVEYVCNRPEYRPFIAKTLQLLRRVQNNFLEYETDR